MLKQVWMHFWSFVPKSSSDEGMSLHKGSSAVMKTSREDPFQVTVVVSVSFRCRNIGKMRSYGAQASKAKQCSFKQEGQKTEHR